MATQWWLCVCSLGILLLVPCALSDKFSLDGSLHPVVGVVGQDVVLPCQLSPRARLANMGVLWRKIDTGFIPVHEYSDQGPKNQPGEGYQSRTELFPQEFSNGNVSLKLKQLQESDAGTYHCFVSDPDWSQEATTELRIAAVAPVFIDVLGPQGQGIGLACKSSGWFPKPEVQWVGKNRQNLATEIVTDMTQDGENLYSVVSQVTVTEGKDTGYIICILRNSILEKEQQSAIHLSGDVFPRVSPWLAAFWALLAVVIIAAGVYAYCKYTAKQKKKRTEEEAPLKDQKTLEAECQDLQEKLKMKDKARDTECQELREKQEAVEKEKKVLKSECQDLQEKWEAVQKEKEALKSECQDLQEKLKMKDKARDTECQELREKQDVVKEKEALQSECQDLQEKLKAVEKEKKVLKSECQELREKLEMKDKARDTECQELREKQDVVKEKEALQSGNQELQKKLERQKQLIGEGCQELPQENETEKKEKKQWSLGSVQKKKMPEESEQELQKKLERQKQLIGEAPDTAQQPEPGGQGS
ncbi:uncharacterized protein LOC102457443 [Pelodiscus sinensis]|uniref:uncharacterized protein LOC102457443 n=1 Tax=Pelodiscus sinensis TaxID=13735 RepID=UPI003F6CBB70